MPQYAVSETAIVNKDAISTDKLLIKKLWTRKLLKTMTTRHDRQQCSGRRFLWPTTKASITQHQMSRNCVRSCSMAICKNCNTLKLVVGNGVSGPCFDVA